MLSYSSRTGKSLIIAACLMLNGTARSEEKTLEVMIAPGLGSVVVRHERSAVTVQRIQDLNHFLTGEMARTSRKCPPHCVQPIKIPGIETIGELELLGFLRRSAEGDQSILVIDTRNKKYVAKGTIPGSINIDGNLLIEDGGANPITIEEILTKWFGVSGQEGAWNFQKAKTLVLYCYGIWCGQAPRTIDALTTLGYPKYKIKWYRGGMQAWESLGLTTIRAEP